MKLSSDPRHKKRVKAIKELFGLSFQATKRGKKSLNNLTIKVNQKVKKIDKIIEDSAPQFPIEQINKIDLAILRLSVWELIFGKTAPYKVIIDEAIEIAKEYGSEKSPQFINGALGGVVKKYVSKT
jgi:N utilization substance protein B